MLIFPFAAAHKTAKLAKSVSVGFAKIMKG